MSIVPVILWVLWSQIGTPLDARPVMQFEGMSNCLEWAENYRQTDRYKADVDKLSAGGVTTTLVCLPAGVRP